MSDADDELKDSDLKETENIFEQLMQLLRELFNIQSDKKNEKANTKDDNEVVALDKDDNKEEVGEEKTENTESSDKEGTLDNDLEAALTQIMKAMMLIGGQINALTSK